MVIHSKKSQFFIMSLVLIYLAIIIIFTYVRSADYTSVSLFDKSTQLELENYIEQAKTRNNWLPGVGATYWMADMDFQNRKRVQILWIGAAPGGNYSIEINPSLTSSDLINCQKEIRVFNNATQADEWADVTSASPPCNVVWNLQNPSAGSYYFYIYYDNYQAAAPAHRSGSASGNSPVGGLWTYFVRNEETSPAYSFCTTLTDIYSRAGIYINCTTNITTTAPNTNKVNTTLVFKATDLEFNGTIF